MSQDAKPVGPILFVCVSGPDQGKRLALTEREAVVGRSAQCELLSDDPDVAERHAVFQISNNQPGYRALESAAVFVDGQRSAAGSIAPQQQLRMGRSLWQLSTPGSGPGLTGWIETIGDRISEVAGMEKIQGFDLRTMFSEVFRKRTDEEVETYFTVGTGVTTPDLLAVDTSWPRPWVFLQTFAVSLIAYLGFVFAVNEFDNPKLIPGLIMTGTFLIPFSVMILFFEVNVLRNVSVYQITKLLLLGGILSLILSLFLFQWTNLDSWLGAMSAGIVEETGKAAALLLVINKPKYRWTLNGLLFGAAVGTGFSAFESAGYAFLNIWDYGARAMMSVITTRGLLSILGLHVIWTSMVGAALWRVRGDQRFRFEMLKDPRFLRVFGLAVAIHMLWNSPIPPAFNLKYIALGFVAWIVNLSLIQDGLKQIRQEQEKLRPRPQP